MRVDEPPTLRRPQALFVQCGPRPVLICDPRDWRDSKLNDADFSRRRRRLIVLGMHRSGTSVVTNLLSQLGFYIGEEGELTTPSWQNPQGFFERRDLRAICDDLLHRSGADWWKVSNFDADAVSGELVARTLPLIRQLVSDLDNHGSWAIKEPRLCLLLPIFLSVIRDPAVVLVVRDPVEVAQSLRRRNGFATPVGLALWEGYICAALRHSAHLPRLILNYHDLLASPDHVAADLVERLTGIGFEGLSATDAARVVDRSLYREHAEPQTPVELSHAQSRLWRSLTIDGEEEQTPGCSQAASFILRQFEADETDRRNRVEALRASEKELKGERAKLAKL